jgi:23S rRNA pseudouridine2605 synthase
VRINKYLALATGISRRTADRVIAAGRVTINGNSAKLGFDVSVTDNVRLDDRLVDGTTALAEPALITIMLNKPIGYVVSRNGQGSKTVYDLLPSKYHHLKPIGRLDKNSSGLLLLTNDGQLAFQLTHPSKHKTKVYEIALDKKLVSSHQNMINRGGVMLEDGLSRLALHGPLDEESKRWRVVMHEGRNRQIIRTFQHLGYTVTAIHRTAFGNYELGDLASRRIKIFV